MKNRIILHIDMDYFFAQVEERENPHFKGKPIVVGANPKNCRGVVSTANLQARKYGIKSALPISEAWRKCPEAIFLPVNHQLYGRVSERIMDIIKKYSPKCQISGVDEAYLDVSLLKSYKKAENLAKNLKKEIFKKEKLTSTIGIGPNKTVAKIAAEKAKPNGLLLITPARIREFLDPLDIQDLPGIGPKTAAKLNGLGIFKIKDLRKSRKVLVDLLGTAGITIYQRARGIDKEEVSSEEVVKSVGQEHTFEKDTRDPEIIFNTFEKIIEDVWRELLANNYVFKTITVICRFKGFETHTKSKTFKEPINNLEILRREAKKLLLKVLVENLKLVRLIGLRIKIC